MARDTCRRACTCGESQCTRTIRSSFSGSIFHLIASFESFTYLLSCLVAFLLPWASYILFLNFGFIWKASYSLIS